MGIGLIMKTASLMASSPDVSQRSLPNVIIIYADDLGYGDLECYDAKNVLTPAVNSLANDGILFNNAYAVAATSTPSRYSLLTGEYAWRKKGTDVAAGDAAMIINPNQYTLADVFKIRDIELQLSGSGIWGLELRQANRIGMLLCLLIREILALTIHILWQQQLIGFHVFL